MAKRRKCLKTAKKRKLVLTGTLKSSGLSPQDTKILWWDNVKPSYDSANVEVISKKCLLGRKIFRTMGFKNGKIKITLERM